MPTPKTTQEAKRYVKVMFVHNYGNDDYKDHFDTWLATLTNDDSVYDILKSGSDYIKANRPAEPEE